MSETKALEFFGLAGLEFWETGGGCTAYGRTLEDDTHYVLVTEADGEHHPVKDGPCDVWIFSSDESGAGFDGRSVRATSFADAITQANKLAEECLGAEELA